MLTSRQASTTTEKFVYFYPVVCTKFTKSAPKKTQLLPFSKFLYVYFVFAVSQPFYVGRSITIARVLPLLHGLHQFLKGTKVVHCYQIHRNVKNFNIISQTEAAQN